MPADKPTTSELIQELRSISDYLSDKQPFIEDIPILTEVAEKPSTESSKAKASGMTQLSNPDADIQPASKELEPSDAADKASPEANKTAGKPAGTSKPSTSLFDKPAQQKQVTSREDTAKSTNDKNNAKRPEMKARGENPFLPPHIRKQLGKHKQTASAETPLWPKSDAAEAPAEPSTGKKVEVQGDLLAGFGESMVEKPETKALNEDDKSVERIVDEVLKEVMPQIETRLREKLKINIAAWKNSE